MKRKLVVLSVFIMMGVLGFVTNSAFAEDEAKIYCTLTIDSDVHTEKNPAYLEGGSDCNVDIAWGFYDKNLDEFILGGFLFGYAENGKSYEIGWPFKHYHTGIITVRTIKRQTPPPKEEPKPSNPPKEDPKPTEPPKGEPKPTTPPKEEPKPSNPPKDGTKPSNPPKEETQPSNPPKKDTSTNPPKNKGGDSGSSKGEETKAPSIIGQNGGTKAPSYSINDEKSESTSSNQEKEVEKDEKEQQSDKEEITDDDEQAESGDNEQLNNGQKSTSGQGEKELATETKISNEKDGGKFLSSILVIIFSFLTLGSLGVVGYKWYRNKQRNYID